MTAPSYRGYRFLADVIQRAVWMYLRFTLSYRDVEDLLAERGIQVSYETIRRWVHVFGPGIARRLRARRPKPHGRWHLDEMFVRIDGKQMYLWRAVDAEGEVLDVLVQSKRDKAAARKLMRKLLKKYAAVPDEWVTDRYASYGAAWRDLGPTTSGPHFSQAHEQPGRKFACSGATTRVEAARLQVAGFGAALLVHACRHLQYFHYSPSPHVRPNAPALSSRGVLGVATCGGCSRLIPATPCPFRDRAPAP